MCLSLEHLVTLYNQCCKYHLSTTDVGIASLCCLDCQRWKKGSAAVCSEQPWLWTELFTQGGLDTCTLKDAVFPTTCPLKLSKVILNLTLMLLLKWNWSSFIVVLCPRLNCCWRLLCSLDLLRYAHPPKSISQACVHVCVCLLFFLKLSFPECQHQIIKKEIILTEAWGGCDWKGHVLHSQIMETVPSNWCSPAGRSRRVQCFTTECDKWVK